MKDDVCKRFGYVPCKNAFYFPLKWAENKRLSIFTILNVKIKNYVERILCVFTFLRGDGHSRCD